MMKDTKEKMRNRILSVWLSVLCLCAVLLFCTAFAEDPVDLENTEKHEGFNGFCELTDGAWILAGYTEIPDESGPDKGRILCLNPDRSVRWEFTDMDTFGYGTVVLTEDNLLAAYYFDGVKFLTPDGVCTGKDIPLPYLNGNMYDITPFGILKAQRLNDETAEDVELTDWDGNRLFRIHEPESMWMGTIPITDENSLVFYGREAGDPAEAAAKMMKVDLQGNTVWETEMPFLSDRRTCTGLQSGMKTADGGYLAVLWESKINSESGEMEGEYALVRLDSMGKILWINRSDLTFWQLAEYDGKYVAYGRKTDAETNRTILHYLWMDPDGKELGTTELEIKEEDLPRYVDSGNMSLTVEKLIPMDDGLWQVLCFWDTDEPEVEDPAWFQQDNILVRVPEL